MAISVMTWVWNHSRSRHGARLVLLAVADCASADGGNAWPSNAELQRKSGLTERAVRQALAELVKLGELEIAANAGPHGCNRYRVTMDEGGNICPPAEIAPLQNLPGSDGDAESPQVKAEDPAEIAPGAKNAGGQKTTARGANIAPGTVNEPKPQKKTSSSSDARATRLPDDFSVTPEMVAWAREHVPRLIDAGRGTYETDKFRDHWKQASGANARKRDWPAAWRNWLRRADDELGKTGPPRAGHAPAKSTTDERARQALEAGRRVQAMLNGGS